MTARLLPGPQGQPAATAPVPPASFTPAPHSAPVVFSQARAEGRGQGSRRPSRAGRPRDRATQLGGRPAWIREGRSVGLQMFFPHCALSAARRSSLSPSPARFLIRGPKGGALRRFLPPAALMRGLPMVKGDRPDRAPEHKKKIMKTKSNKNQSSELQSRPEQLSTDKNTAAATGSCRRQPS